jgi:hypothetical protein
MQRPPNPVTVWEQKEIRSTRVVDDEISRSNSGNKEKKKGVWEYKKERNKRNIATCSDLCIDLLL